ncbi:MULTISPECIES: lytic polysaccharide monooxygenase [Bacillus cereus group]|uniref:lytic polysaccharide monooxygenase n=1 Tax=Bacillus cereus group TaxID=86661 RepID=UPI001F57ED5A|nr:lytic polysaccharide monooxygenase [Bacillus cereus group sp. BfR-BA-01522]
MKKKKWQSMKKVILSCGIILTGVITFGFAEKASAHGYVESPSSRSYLCSEGVNVNCGPIQYEPQSVEGVGGFPQSGPVDGQIAGAGNFPNLDVQTAERWKKVTIQGGKNEFKWKLTAPHSTKEWKYYITKKDWNPNKPLSRSQLDLIPFYVKNDGGVKPGVTVTHEANVPTDRSGYHLILAVWEIADTGNAFYQVMDVNLVNNGVTSIMHHASHDN